MQAYKVKCDPRPPHRLWCMQIKALGCSDHLHFVRSVNIGCGTNHWKGISQNQAYWESVVVGLSIYIACCKQAG